MIRAFPKVAEAIPDVVHVIAGAGPDHGRLRSLAAELGLTDRVRQVGFVDESDLPLAYRSCDVYAMVSRETERDLEGYGITYLEAAACGKTAVAGCSGGVEDAVIDGETGLLVDPEDIDAVAQALIDVITDKSLRTELAERARARVLREITRKAMIERIVSLSESV